MTAKTIRIDAEVYLWIESQAAGFESINDTMRRIAGLPPHDRIKRRMELRGAKTTVEEKHGCETTRNHI